VKDICHNGPVFSSFRAMGILNELDLKEFIGKSIFIGKR
jgi:hypothetical protein